MNLRARIGKRVVFGVGATLSFAYFFPFFLVFANSLKLKPDILENPLSLPIQITWDNFQQAYIKMNDRRRMIECGHTCANYHDTPAMYDGSAPEVLEEPDADYVPTAKARKITPKQAIVQALDALKLGDVDTAQCILTEALK